MAIKKGQIKERAPAFTDMGTFRCDRCGEEFIVFHAPVCVDKKAAERQARWLEKVLAEDTNEDGSTQIEFNYQISTTSPRPKSRRNLSVTAWLH